MAPPAKQEKKEPKGTAKEPGAAPRPAPQKPAPPPPKPTKRKGERPSRTLQPVMNSGEAGPPAPKFPGDEERIGQWPMRGAPGVDTLFGWDVDSVGNALRLHANGQPRKSGLLLDDLRANPIVGNCVETRQEAWRTLPRAVVPGRGAGASRFADFVREVLPDILPDGTLDDWWLHLAFQGESLSGMDWEERTDGRDRWWLPLIKPWHPSQFYHQYRPDVAARTADGQVVVANTRDQGPLIVEPGMGRWVYVARGTLTPWLNGLIRALGEPFLGDTYTLRDNLALQERFGQGVVKFFHPVEWNAAQVDVGVATVRSSGRGGVISCPQTTGPDGKMIRKVDLEMLAADATGASIFDLTERRLLRRFLISLLGQDMTTVGQTGGFAQAAIHNQVLWHKRERDAATFGDARLVVDVDDAGKVRRKWVPYTGPIRQQIMRWVAWFNVGSFDAAPYVYWDATPPEDLTEKHKAEAQAASQKAATVASLVAAIPALRELYPDLDPSFVFEQCGVTLFRDPEAIVRSVLRKIPEEKRLAALRAFVAEYATREE